MLADGDANATVRNVAGDVIQRAHLGAAVCMRTLMCRTKLVKRRDSGPAMSEVVRGLLDLDVVRGRALIPVEPWQLHTSRCQA